MFMGLDMILLQWPETYVDKVFSCTVISIEVLEKRYKCTRKLEALNSKHQNT